VIAGASLLGSGAYTKNSRASPAHDLQIVRELARVIRFLFHDGVTVLLIEQNLKLAAEVADRLATMVKARIVYSATPATFSAEE
jgi:ABC-type branched-subunit amino acid transport system ATPase component